MIKFSVEGMVDKDFKYTSIVILKKITEKSIVAYTQGLAACFYPGQKDTPKQLVFNRQTGKGRGQLNISIPKEVLNKIKKFEGHDFDFTPIELLMHRNSKDIQISQFITKEAKQNQRELDAEWPAEARMS